MVLSKHLQLRTAYARISIRHRKEYDGCAACGAYRHHRPSCAGDCTAGRVVRSFGRFFYFAVRRHSFGAFRRQHFMQLAYHGRLVLLLDGWNELDPESRKRALGDLVAFRRDYPQLAVVVGTRRHALPIAGETIAIEPLSIDQQLAVARAQRGTEGEALVDVAIRTAGIREFLAIPLYLNALLCLPDHPSHNQGRSAADVRDDA